RRHTRFDCDWSSDVCSSDLKLRHETKFPHRTGRCGPKGVSLWRTGADRGTYAPQFRRLAIMNSSKTANATARLGRLLDFLDKDRSEERREGKSVDIGGCSRS